MMPNFANKLHSWILCEAVSLERKVDPKRLGAKVTWRSCPPAQKCVPLDAVRSHSGGCGCNGFFHKGEQESIPRGNEGSKRYRENEGNVRASICLWDAQQGISVEIVS